MAASLIGFARLGFVALSALVVASVARDCFAQESRTAKSGIASAATSASAANKGRTISPGADRQMVASVNDKPIYKADVERALAALARGQQVEPTPQLLAGALAQVINQRLLFDFIEKNNLAATADQVDKGVEMVRKKNPSLEKDLRDRRTMEGLRNQVHGELSLQNFLQKYATEEMIQAYFARNAKQFDGTQLRASHILLRPAQNGSPPEAAELFRKAQRIKSEIEAGTITFADAAKKYSAGPSRQEGGDLGFIQRGGPMVEQFNAAAYDLEQGKISDPVTSPFGLHLITVTDSKPGDKKLTDTEVRTRVVQALSQYLLAKLLEKQLKTAKIEFNDSFPHFKPGTQELVSAGK